MVRRDIFKDGMNEAQIMQDTAFAHFCGEMEPEEMKVIAKFIHNNGTVWQADYNAFSDGFIKGWNACFTYIKSHFLVTER